MQVISFDFVLQWSAFGMRGINQRIMRSETQGEACCHCYSQINQTLLSPPLNARAIFILLIHLHISLCMCMSIHTSSKRLSCCLTQSVLNIPDTSNNNKRHIEILHFNLNWMRLFQVKLKHMHIIPLADINVIFL